MAEENAIKPLKTISIKCEEEAIEQFTRLREQSGISTNGQFFAALLDRYEQPQRVADDRRELENRVRQLQEQVVNLQSDLERSRTENGELGQLLDEARATANENADLANSQQMAFERQLGERVKLEENQAVITLLPDSQKALDWVCARESRRRKQQWSRSHVINYFIHSRFIKGNLNGDLDAVPDSELRKMGISLGRRGKEDFEL